MNGRLAALGIALLGLAVWFALSAQVTRPADFGGGPRAARPAPPPPAAPSLPPERLTRNPFRYADEAPARAAPSAPAPARSPAPAATLPPPTPEPVRLSGFVRRGGELKAVLSVGGTTLVVAVGESAEGYRVLSVDEDAGVRLRGRSGEEMLLRPAPAR
jgi:hypothetical protein